MMAVRSLSLASTLLAAAFLTACDGHSSSLRHDDRRAIAEARHADRLESRVLSALQSDYRIQGRKTIQVSVLEEGVVEIRGQVAGPNDKDEATATARRVPGVRRVINNMSN